MIFATYAFGALALLFGMTAAVYLTALRYEAHAEHALKLQWYGAAATLFFIIFIALFTVTFSLSVMGG